MSRFEDGCVAIGAGSGWAWALNIVLRDGRVITTSLGPLEETTSPKTLAAIRQATERHEIPAELTGQQMAPHVHPRIDDLQSRRPARDPGAATVIGERIPRWEAIIGTVICGGIAAYAPPDKLFTSGKARSCAERRRLPGPGRRRGDLGLFPWLAHGGAHG